MWHQGDPGTLATDDWTGADTYEAEPIRLSLWGVGVCLRGSPLSPDHSKEEMMGTQELRLPWGLQVSTSSPVPLEAINTVCRGRQRKQTYREEQEMKGGVWILALLLHRHPGGPGRLSASFQ